MPGTYPDARASGLEAWADNAIVAHHFGAAQRRRSALAQPIVEAASLAAIAAALMLASLPASMDALLAVGLIGLAAGRTAATTDDRRRGPGRRRPANDNPFGRVLPPPLLRC